MRNHETCDSTASRETKPGGGHERDAQQVEQHDQQTHDRKELRAVQRGLAETQPAHLLHQAVAQRQKRNRVQTRLAIHHLH